MTLDCTGILTETRVCTAPGDRVPGPRSHGLLRPVKFPWREAVDAIEEVGSWKSYLQSAHLIRQGIVCGPSSGFNLQGLFQCIEKRKADRTLSDLAGPDGEVHCAFLCCDLPYQYVDEYFEKLGEAFFPAITNKVSDAGGRRAVREKKRKKSVDQSRLGTSRCRQLSLRRSVGAGCFRGAEHILSRQQGGRQRRSFRWKDGPSQI